MGGPDWVEGELRYAPNISWLLPELPVSERPRALAAAGFGAIEFGFPSAMDLEALRRAREELGLEIVLFNQDVPVWDRHNRGYLCDPARREEFRSRFDEALRLAGTLSVAKIMLPAGVELDGVDRRKQHDLVVENLRWAAPLAGQAGVMLTIEVLNPQDNPGYFLTSSFEALQIVRQVDHPSLRFQFDTYHLEALEGSLLEAIQDIGPRIGHVQFADYPGRGRPGSGKLDFAAILAALSAAGYAGYIGLEYIPREPGLAALAWVPAGMRSREGVISNLEEHRR
jgi:hydroxypyruvate isomerase